MTEWNDGNTPTGDENLWYLLTQVPPEDREDWDPKIRMSVEGLEAQMAKQAAADADNERPAPANVIAARELMAGVELDFFYVTKLLEKVLARCVDHATAIDGFWTKERAQECLGPVIRDADIEAEIREVFRGLVLQILFVINHEPQH
ncbi:hypothetical protein [Acidihalobacter prosperus]|uniref:Uncharacterized protein n=1 Tax=Acidihalobacter prosperus TaxID=160660 RepID=A0A1A6C6T2_9GAMM|nr:hypothetical protein [Acidihalobacter prosperus]OBS10268.1 hypothetical protein Thpro_021318 [Acidihalobacter prosperus]